MLSVKPYLVLQITNPHGWINMQGGLEEKLGLLDHSLPPSLCALCMHPVIFVKYPSNTVMESLYYHPRNFN